MSTSNHDLVTYAVLVLKRTRYRVEAASPFEAQTLALAAAQGIGRDDRRVTVEWRTVTAEAPEMVETPE